MLTKAENDQLTQVEGDAPMGQLFRRFWLPMVLSEEIAEPDGAPAPVRVLGAGTGRVPRHERARSACSTRAARTGSPRSSFGRNEECGLRCIYHGWKFDVDGNCMDMPTEPDDRGFKDRLKAKAYPIREAAGMVWAYLGPREHEPPFPAFPWTALPGNQVGVAKSGYHSNYLQAVEGAIDSAHSWYLHRGSSRDWEKRFEVSSDQSPRLEAEDTPYGFRYAAIRVPNVDPETTKYARVTIFNVPVDLVDSAAARSESAGAHVDLRADGRREHDALRHLPQSERHAGRPAALRRRLKVEPGVDLDEDWFFTGGREEPLEPRSRRDEKRQLHRHRGLPESGHRGG